MAPWIHGRCPTARRDTGPDTGQLMLLTAFVLVIAFVALAGMVARVTQLPSETRQSADRPIFTESRAITAGLTDTLDALAGIHGTTDGDAIHNISYDFNAAVRHLGVLQSARGYGFQASPLVCTDRGDDGSGSSTNTIRLWMEFTLRDTQTKISRSIAVEMDGLSSAMPCPDPGFAFEDANGDLLFDRDDGDQNMTEVGGDVTDGVHETQPGFGLVIPASVGAITGDPGGELLPGLTGLWFKADGPTLIAVDVTNNGASADDEVHIHTAAGDLWIAGITISADAVDADVTVAGAGQLHMEWSTLQATGTSACVNLHDTDASHTLYVQELKIDDSDNTMKGDSTRFRVVGTPHADTADPPFSTAACTI